MRTNFSNSVAFLLFLSATMLVLCSSCQKETISISKLTTEVVPDENEAFFQTIEGELVTYLQDAKNIDNEKMNMILYYFSQAINEAIQMEHFRDLLLNELQNSENQEVSIISLAMDKVDLKQFLNASIQRSIERTSYPLLRPNTKDYITFLGNEMIYADIKYEPFLYTIKQYDYKTTKDIVIAIGEQVDDIDNVVGWEKDKTVLIGENQVMDYEGIVFFIGNGVPKQLEENTFNNTTNNFPYTEGDMVNSRAKTFIKIQTYQIFNPHFFERRGDLEVENFIGYTLPSSSSNNIGSDETIKVARSSVENSTLFTNQNIELDSKDDAFFGPTGGINYIWTAYEHDWYAKKKTIVCSCSCDGASLLSIGARMKYEHEFYNTNCGILSNDFSSVGSSFEVQNNKSRFKIERTD